MDQGSGRGEGSPAGLIDQRASELIRELYVGAERQPTEGFRSWALALARRHVPFDSAMWGTGGLRPQVAIDSVTLFRQPAEMMARYRRRWMRGDVMAQAVLGDVGRTVNLVDLMPRETFLRSPLYRQFGRRFGICHVLSTASAEPRAGLVTFMSWWRDGHGHPFSEAERQFKQFLVPHLVLANRMNTFQHLRQALSDRGAPDTAGAYAIATAGGVLTEAEAEFTALLQRANPDWTGPVLPPAFKKPLRGRGDGECAALGLHLRLTRAGEQVVLRLREPLPVDRLSPAERRIAEQLAGGLTHRQIATQLALAPSTVRNHLHAIYRKLGVANRVQMLNAMHATPATGTAKSESGAPT